MNIIVLTHKPRPIDIDELFGAIKNTSGFVTIINVHPEECGDLKPILEALAISENDLVVFDIPFKRLYKQAHLVKRYRQVLIYEEDAYQNFLPISRWYKKFEKFYQEAGNPQVINTGFHVSQRFRALGLNSHFLPKGFSAKRLFPEPGTRRDIALGFVGSLGSRVYSERNRAIERLVVSCGLQALRTSSPLEYRQTLNRIQLFFSADIGMEEYMCKNFEAMACGCVLVACQQGNGEEEALGLQDMVNAVLYKTLDEAEEKIRFIQAHPGKLEAVAKAGAQHALNRFEFGHLGQQLVAIINNSFK